MRKKITVKREAVCCDRCGKQLDWGDMEYFNHTYEIDGQGEYCHDCSVAAWTCDDCGKIFFEDEGNKPIEIRDEDYCIDCAKKFANDILAQVKEGEKQ